jgi:hypothetical protein
VLGADKKLKTKKEVNLTETKMRTRDIRRSKRSLNITDASKPNDEDDYSDEDSAGTWIRASLSLTIGIILYAAPVHLAYTVHL